VTRTQRQIDEHRTGGGCIEVRDATGRPRAKVPVWVEQESHAFVFGCVAPDLDAVSEINQQRCRDRLGEVFNQIVPAGSSTSGATHLDIPDGVRLGRLRQDMDRLASAGEPLEVWVAGQSVGLGPDADERIAAERVAALYTLCFAHPSVCAIIWDGFWDGGAGTDGTGLLRRDFAPKPAFRYLQKLIGTIWHSRGSGLTDVDGRFTFRGFFGDYRVAARAGPVTTSALFSFRDSAGACFPLQLQMPREDEL
jgi:hypothetical protein